MRYLYDLLLADEIVTPDRIKPDLVLCNARVDLHINYRSLGAFATRCHQL